MAGQTPPEALLRLAEIRGIEPGYVNGAGVWVTPSIDTLMALLPVLGESIDRPEQATDRLRVARLEQLKSPMPPVVVAWTQSPSLPTSAYVPVTLPAKLKGPFLTLLTHPDGKKLERTVTLEQMPAEASLRPDGELLVRRKVTVEGLTPGVYRFEFAVTDAQWLACQVLVAPAKAYRPADKRPGKSDWGLFLPVHAMRSEHNHGCGDFGDLATTMRLTGGVGGHLFGTLPLLSTFLEDPVVEPSPYAPASRLFWNELYLNIESIPELQLSQKARDLLADPAWRMERDRLVALQLVDHAGVWRLRLPVLDALVEAFPLTGPRARQLEAFVARRPRVRAYAAFRARMDRERATWPTWAMSNQAPDETSLLYRRYLLAQFWADEQVAEISTSCSKWGLRGLYLDLPLGVHSDSFDTWFYKDHFARGVSAGAPPDDFFTLGQDWGFPPLHPTRIRELGHEYLRDVLDFHSSSAALLRMDHVMGLFRLYWVPWGMGPKAGAYVRYPAEEMLALFTLASNQHQCALVGEDLGTVPPAVRPAMHAHGIDRLYVAQFSLHTQEPVLDMPPEDSLACINTHDLPPFAAFWLGRDIDDRRDLGLMDDTQLIADHLARKKLREAVARKLKLLAPVETGTTGDKAEEDQTLSIDPSKVLMGLIKILRGSANRGLLINLEDLWNAKDPQNVPGTWRERPNWQRKSAFDLESMANTVPVDRIVKWLEESQKEVL